MVIELANILESLPDSQKRGSFASTFINAVDRFGMSPINIIETGSIRVNADLWSDGGSTRYWRKWVEATDSKLWVVDLSEKNIAECRSIIGEHPNIQYVVSDSEVFLKDFNQKIHLLFLDSMDCEPPIETTWEHQLKECQLALDKLDPAALILMDDFNGFDRIDESKSKYSIPYLENLGFKILNQSDHQILFGREK